MTMDVRSCMLAGKMDLAKVSFPILCSPKLDGIRATIQHKLPWSRNKKVIPNAYVQSLFRDFEDYDGELIVGDPTDKNCFNKTTSGVMSRDGEPDVKLYVFDHMANMRDTYINRKKLLIPSDKVVVVEQRFIENMEQLLAFENEQLELGYEGIMGRSLHGHYKEGRSTTREGILMKLKRFLDGEAIIMRVVELLHNANEAKMGSNGYMERSSHKENMIPMGRMGMLEVRDIKTGVEFGVGTGFDDDARDWFWRYRNEVIGRVIRYKFFPIGVKDKPRFPVYDGFRHEDDM